MAHTVPRVQLAGVSKLYPGVQALEEVSFEIAAGQVHALVGENGAGKSTLVRILAGVTRPDAGKIFIDGHMVEILGARLSASLGISVVHQEFSLADDLSVAENVFLGRWPRGRWGAVDFRTLHRRAESLFQSLGVQLPLDLVTRDLSVAQQQMVEIARALSMDARLLVLDEPSAVLSPTEVAALFRIVRRLTARSVSVLYVSHRLDEIFDQCDQVTVLRDGRHIITRAVSETNRELLIREMVGRPIDQEFPVRSSKKGKTVVRVDGLSAPRRFQDVSFEVRSGEVFALTGLVGSGRSSVGNAVFGAVPNVKGDLHVGGVKGKFRSPRQAKSAGIALVPEDRRRQGLMLERSLSQNMSLADYGAVSRFGILRVGRERNLTQRWIRELQIKATGPDVATATLSGGNQQKVMIARWLGKPCRVMILDEPTRGVDVGAKTEIYSIINDQASRGTAVILITSELPEAVGMADRIGVMASGRLRGILDNGNHSITQEMILELAVPTSARAELPSQGEPAP